MLTVLSIILILAAIVIIFFNVPYSKTRTEFSNKINNIISNIPAKMASQPEVFTKDDIKTLPPPVQKYFESCGFLGIPKMSYMKATFKNVDFDMSADKTIKIDYTQYNFVDKPNRFAFIDSSLFGIPFEGLDSFENGAGSMKGRFAKVITLFDQRGENMDKASLVTFLAESLFVPNAALQDYVQWKDVDATHAAAIISYNGITAGGVFTFNGNGEMVSFRTKDRVATNMDGSTREAEWSAIILDYQTVNNLKLPKTVQSIWHYPEGDNIYFNENKASIVIEYN